jgi:ribosomal protein S18 acetylase RimI-like enzyme
VEGGRRDGGAPPLSVTIATFRPEHAAAFDALNREWLVAHGLLEPADEVQLADPVGQILGEGGQIYVALEGSEVLGTCAAVPHGPGAFEVAKLAVAQQARGQGLGRRLVDACLVYARAQGATTAVLVSSTRLQAALRLYERMGFTYAAVPESVPYATADVYMTLSLR